MDDMKRMNCSIRLEQYRASVKELRILNDIIESDEFEVSIADSRHYEATMRVLYENEVQIQAMEIRIKQLEQELGETGE